MPDRRCRRIDIPTSYVCLCLLLFAFLGCTIASAASKANINDVIDQASKQRLARDTYWLRLVHYRKTANQFHSEIVTSGFFLAADGASNPVAELNATIRAIFAPPAQDPDQHAQCRFIARYQWLNKMLDLARWRPPRVECRAFAKWSLHGKIDSLSLVYATGYLGNPASFYGHLLLKFNSDRHNLPSDLLDRSLNFGAIVPDNENAVVYILKGLFGGYKAGFSGGRFYYLNHNYAENELRDLWEYRLSFSKAETHKILTHAWELLGNDYIYYFLNQNCAYRMAELLQLVIDRPLLPQALPWSVPGSVFDTLVTLNWRGRPLVRSVHHIPSRQNRFYARFDRLEATQQNTLKHLVRKGFDPLDRNYLQLTARQRAPVIDAMLDYYDFQIVSHSNEKGNRTIKRRLLLERLSLPVIPPDNDSSHSALPPHSGPKPSMVRVGWLHNRVLGDGASMQLRPAYFDTLSLDGGRIPHSWLTMLDLEVVRFAGQYQIRNLDLVKLKAINPSRTGLPGDKGYSWTFNVGVKSQDLGCQDCTIFHVGGSLGRAFYLSGSTVLYGMTGLVGQSNYDSVGTLKGDLTAGLIIRPAAGWKLAVRAGYQKYLNDSRQGVKVFQWDNRIGRSRDWDIRVSFARNVANEARIAASLYW